MAKDLPRDEHEWSMQRPPSAARICLMKMLDIVYTHVRVNKLVNDKANKSPNYSNPLDLCETFTRLCSAASSLVVWSLVTGQCQKNPLELADSGQHKDSWIYSDSIQWSYLSLYILSGHWAGHLWVQYLEEEPGRHLRNPITHKGKGN